MKSGELSQTGVGRDHGLVAELAARLVGIIVDGVVPKQWALVAVEAVFMALAALWLWRSSGSAP